MRTCAGVWAGVRASAAFLIAPDNIGTVIGAIHVRTYVKVTGEKRWEQYPLSSALMSNQTSALSTVAPLKTGRDSHRLPSSSVHCAPAWQRPRARPRTSLGSLGWTRR